MKISKFLFSILIVLGFLLLVVSCNSNRRIYNLTVKVNNQNAGTVTILDKVTCYQSQKVFEGAQISLVTESNPGYNFDGWYDEQNLLSVEPTYLFIMPEKDVVPSFFSHLIIWFSGRFSAVNDICEPHS